MMDSSGLTRMDLDDPFDVATNCLALGKGILAICRPPEEPPSLLGTNKLDLMLSGLSKALRGEWSPQLVRLEKTIDKQLNLGNTGNDALPDLTIPALRGLLGALDALIRHVASHPTILDACRLRALSQGPVTVGSIVSRSGHSAAIEFGQDVLLAVRSALDGGVFVRPRGDLTEHVLDVQHILPEHLERITESFQGFPDYDSPVLTKLMATIVLEKEQASATVPPGLEPLWPEFTDMERDIVSKIWRNRKKDDFRSADLYVMLGWESVPDPNNNFAVHQSNIKAKLRDENLRLPWERKRGKIRWIGLAETSK